jgi:NADPH:quinone reductase-like Zn-dependent oxidoreductase
MGPAAGAFMGWRHPKHPILGTDAAGVVAAVGDGVTGFAPGDDVLVWRGLAMGCHVEYLTVAADGGIAHAPRDLTPQEAASLVFGASTALVFLDRVELGPGMRVLVNGASGAVGTMAVQLAHAAGAHVTGVTSGRNEELVRYLGADRVVDYTTTDFARESAQYDVIVECVGNAPYPRVAPVLRRGGALLLVISELPGMLLARWNGLRLHGLVATHGAKSTLAGTVARIVELADAGTLRPVVDRVYPFDDVVEAHRYVDTGRKRGAVVLTLDEHAA